MVAVRNDDPRPVREVLEAFRGQAKRSATGPEDHRVHPDGWGIAALTADGLVHLGRSAGDAAKDPAYATAVARAAEALPHSWILAHVRNASVGVRRVENSHPFVREGWAFAHNGTVHDLAHEGPLRPEGNTDSERFFLRVLAKSETDRLDALTTTTDEIARTHRHSSLTCLMTDGRVLLGQRRVGPDPGGCGTRECALEYYALGEGSYHGLPVVTQEPGFLPGLTGWRPYQDGEARRYEGRTSVVAARR